MIGVGVDVTLSTSSSTFGCCDAACCAAAFTSDCDEGRGVDFAGLDVDVGLGADIVGEVDVNGGSETGMSSRVTFCCEKREEADEE